MHPYFKHLLIDIENAKRSTTGGYYHDTAKTFEEEMEEMERWVRGDENRPLSTYTLLKKEDFPPAEQLSNQDMEKVLEAFGVMLSTWNARIDFPENMPVKERYHFTLNHVLEDDFFPVSSGFITFDYCTGNSDGCAWGKYCKCRDLDFEN